MRQMRRLTSAFLLGLVALLLATAPASAGVSWCRTDPIVSFNGKVTNTYISTYAEVLKGRASGPTKVVYTFPAGVNARLLYTDNGFGHGYDVQFHTSKAMKVTANGSIPVKIEVLVPAHKPMPVILEWMPESRGVITARAKGNTNRWITLYVTVP